MTAHWASTEADFQRYYGLNLAQACYGASPLGTRRLMALLRGLPQESNFQRELNPDTGWGYQEELLALLAELMDYGNRLFYAAAPFKSKKKMEPIKIPRPGGEKREKKKPSHEEIMRFFGGGN